MRQCECGREFEKHQSYASHCRSCRIHLGREPAPYVGGFRGHTKVAWNKGLTKDTDDRVRKQAESLSKTMTGKVGRPHSKETRERISNTMKEKAQRGELKGFMTRGHESFPEKFWRNVLDTNNINYIREYRVSFKSLGVDHPSAGYFLDFYLEDINLDLEIDGSQHNWEEVREKDLIRDSRLKSAGYIVYRIPFIHPNKSEEVKSQIDQFLEFYQNLCDKSAECSNHS